MKCTKQFLLIITCLIMFNSVFAQCDNVNYDLETNTSATTPGSPVFENAGWINNYLTNWYSSHGNPELHRAPWAGSSYLRFMGDGEPTIHSEGGVFSYYNFYKGATYTLNFDYLWSFTNYHGDHEEDTIYVYLTNGLSPDFSGTTSLPATGGQLITIATHNGLSYNSWLTSSTTFEANEHYSQIWLYYSGAFDHPPGGASEVGICQIDDICVDPGLCGTEPDIMVSMGLNPCEYLLENASTVEPGESILNTQWSYNGTFSNGPSVTVDGTEFVCMTVWYTDGISCCKREVCEYLDIPAACAPCDRMMMSGIDFDPGTGTFSATNMELMHNVYGFLWDFGDGTTGTGQTITHLYGGPGTYDIILTLFYLDEASGECCSFDYMTTINATRSPITGDPEETNDSSNNLRIIPNPNNGNFILELDQATPIYSVHIYDTAGKLVYNLEEIERTGEMTLDLSSLEKGIYIVVTNQNDPEMKNLNRLVIQ